MAKKNKSEFAPNNVERTTVNGRTVYRVRSAKSGRVLSVTPKSSSRRSMEKTKGEYGQALESLANR
jgi:hypothetical protein